MREVNILLLLFSLISVVFGFYNETEIAGLDNVDREDFDFDVENNVADNDSLTIDYINPTIIRNVPEGTNCTEVFETSKQNCVLTKDNHGPFKYGDYTCYLTETFAGANEHYTFADGSDYYHFYIDMNGYMKCKIDGKWYFRYRKFNWQASSGTCTRDQFLSRLNQWSRSTDRLFSGENHFSIGTLSMWITISKCTDVFSTYQKPIPYNCNSGK